MAANEIQHGGDHYKGSLYQHWDWAHEIRLGYLVGTATKYVFRWRKKNGLEDLLKAQHYIEKALEMNAQGSCDNLRHDKFWAMVKSNSLDLTDASIIFDIMEGNFERALQTLGVLIARTRVTDRTSEITLTDLPT